jgi:tRNA (guanine-N7-)-methyltransferase
MGKVHDPSLHHREIIVFPESARVTDIDRLELGPGRGDFLFELAQAHPENLIGAIEIKRKRFEKLKTRIAKKGLKNIVLLLGDARVVVPKMFQVGQIKDLYILFSDPWPKDRHAKHRLFQDYFVEDLYRIVASDGQVFVAHDDPDYLQEIVTLFEQQGGFEIEQLRRGAACCAPTLFTTFYAEKWREEGRTLKAYRFLRSL